MKAGLCIAALSISTAAFAQAPGPPGPYVIDVRGGMSGVPGGSGFYPPVASSTIVPKRGFGLGGGIHLYPFRAGIARLGLGVEAMRIRGTAPTPAAATGTSDTGTADTSASVANAVMGVTTVAGQLSFNFGSRDGWSYLTAGYGTTRTRGAVSSEVPGPILHSVAVLKRQAPTINYGGGARWFLREHLAVGFDLRFHRIAASGDLPGASVFALSAGVSIR
jgi:hypothetical protein